MQDHPADNGRKRRPTPGQQDVIALAVDAALDRKIERLLDGSDPLVERLFAPGGRLDRYLDSATQSITNQASEKAVETMEERAAEFKRQVLEHRAQPPGGEGNGQGPGGAGNGAGGGDDAGSPGQRGEPGDAADSPSGKTRRSAIFSRVIDDVSSDPKTFLGELVNALDRGLDVYDRHADSRVNREARQTNPFLILEGLNQTPMGQAAIGYFAPDQLGAKMPDLLAQAYARGMGAKIQGTAQWQSPSSTTRTALSERPSATSTDPNGSGSAVPTETPGSPTARMGADGATSAGRVGSRPMIELAAPRP